MRVQKKPRGALVFERAGGIDYEVHASGLTVDGDTVLVHVRMSGLAGTTLRWLPGARRWDAKTYDRGCGLADLPDGFRERLEDLLVRLEAA